jgi:hypothetical protein
VRGITFQAHRPPQGLVPVWAAVQVRHGAGWWSGGWEDEGFVTIRHILARTLCVLCVVWEGVCGGYGCGVCVCVAA